MQKNDWYDTYESTEQNVNYFTSETYNTSDDEYNCKNNNEPLVPKMYYGPWPKQIWLPRMDRYLGGLTYPCNVPHCGIGNHSVAYPVSTSDAICRLHDDELRQLSYYDGVWKHHPADDKMIKAFWEQKAWKEANILTPAILLIYAKTCLPNYKQHV